MEVEITGNDIDRIEAAGIVEMVYFNFDTNEYDVKARRR